jgi:hypothetical protein
MNWYIGFVIFLFTTSCISYPLMHDAVSQNVPLLSKKNEGRISVATGTESVGFQAAYSFSKSFAAMGGYSWGMNDIMEYVGDVNINNGTRQSSELAIGYFNPIGAKGVIEIFGGAERYSRSFSVTDYGGYVYNGMFSTNATKPFVQLDLGFHNARKHSISLSVKMGYLFYDHYSFLVLDDQTHKWGPYPQNYVNNDPIIEPCITYRVGGKRISFQAQAGFSYSNTMLFSVYNNTLVTDPFFYNVGLSLRLFKEE